MTLIAAVVLITAASYFLALSVETARAGSRLHSLFDETTVCVALFTSFAASGRALRTPRTV